MTVSFALQGCMEWLTVLESFEHVFLFLYCECVFLCIFTVFIDNTSIVLMFFGKYPKPLELLQETSRNVLVLYLLIQKKN